MIFLIFIIIPILEITIFITVGSNIGVLNTIAIILITALVGIFLVRKRGLSLLFNARQTSSVQTKRYVSKLTLFVANFLKPEIRND